MERLTCTGGFAHPRWAPRCPSVKDFVQRDDDTDTGVA